MCVPALYLLKSLTDRIAERSWKGKEERSRKQYMYFPRDFRRNNGIFQGTFWRNDGIFQGTFGEMIVFFKGLFKIVHLFM
jgi:hypothetical protein